MTTTGLAFAPPGPTLTLNKKLGHLAQARLVKEWRTMAYWAACQLGAPSVRAHPPSTVQLVIPVRGSRRRDPSNWMPTCKAVIDGLVDAGVWPDDNEEWVTVVEPLLSMATATVTVLIRPRRSVSGQ